MKKKDTTIVYAWVLQEKYYIEDGETKIDTSSSIPYKFSLIKENDHYTLKTVETPGDGKNYSKDMKKLFPYSVRKSMDNVYNDGTSENLKYEISEQVLLYYDKDI